MMRPSLSLWLPVLPLLLLACAPSGEEPDGNLPPIDTVVGEGPARFVNVWVGTDDALGVTRPVPNGAGGSTFPAAAAPFGLLQWGPDTPQAVPPGYRYSDSDISAFSLTHLNGAGCPASRDFPLLPTIGESDPEHPRPLSFQHAREIASPGFYEVQLDNGITVDLIAAVHSGLARFSFPTGSEGQLILRNALESDLLVAKDATLQILSPTQIVGSRLDSFCALGVPTRIYFAARFDRPFQGQAFGGDGTDPTQTRSLAGGLLLRFAATRSGVVHMKVGLSSVSSEAALANLDAEIPDWDPNRLRRQTLARWDDLLGRVQVRGGAMAQMVALYTALYRVFLQPAEWSDVDGAYFGFDQRVHPGDGHRHYTHFSGWDIYRSWIALVALLAPNETSDMMRSLIDAAQQGGALPQWAYGSSETGVMIGDPASVMLANAWAYGARDFDPRLALRQMQRNGEDVNARCNDIAARPGLAEYLDRHYVAFDGAHGLDGTTARTLEYAIADSAIAHLAADLGEPSVAGQYRARAGYWRNVFDPQAAAGSYVGAMQPRRFADRGGVADFVPSDVGSSRAVTEGSLEQYTFLVPHDVPGLIAALGGDATFVARLQQHLSQVNTGKHGSFFYIGNEPGFATPWLYPFAGAPGQTQEAVGRILDTAFSLLPSGLPGNDDLGATSSWQAWALLGLYPVVPGVGGLVLSSPRFTRIEIRVPQRPVLRITASNLSPQARYIDGALWNGTAWLVPWLTPEQLRSGGELSLTLAARPSPSWGVAPAHRPQALLP